MATQHLVWPTKADYELAIKDWKHTIQEPTIREGILAQDNVGIHRFGGANLYVSIYKIGHWMIRCFCSNPPRQPPVDIIERYRAISTFCELHQHDVSALVPVTYIEQGIRVGSRIFPVVKMPFLEQLPSLGEFISYHYQERQTMENLCDAWKRMIHEMEAASIAHGDLDLTNVLVEHRPSSILLRLIDYDNVWISALANYPQTEHGHAPFQHPYFLPPNQRPYDAFMDKFSALVIYISLRALITDPELYDEWGADESERLLFSENDYKADSLIDGRIAKLLTRVTDVELRSYIQELAQSLRDRCMPASLDDIAQRTRRAAPLPTLQPIAKMQPPVSLWGQQVYTLGKDIWQPPTPLAADTAGPAQANQPASSLQWTTTGIKGPYDDTAKMRTWVASRPNTIIRSNTTPPGNSVPHGTVPPSTTSPLAGSQKNTIQVQKDKTFSRRLAIIIAVLCAIIIVTIIALIFFFFIKPVLLSLLSIHIYHAVHSSRHMLSSGGRF